MGDEARTRLATTRTLPRVAQRTTPEAAVTVLRKAILSGVLAPGQQLRETHVAAELGISRAPLREALSRLVDEGLVVKYAFRGAFVAEVKAEAVDEIVSLRLRLEPFAIELALQRDRGALLKGLRTLCARLSRAADDGDLAASIDHHLAVHRLFYEMSGHHLLRSMWQEWEGQLRLYLAVDHRSFPHLHDIGVDHLTLLEVVEAGDAAAIAEELGRHLHGPSQPG